MKGDAKVIEYLNAALRSELTAERECNTKLATLVLRHVERAELVARVGDRMAAKVDAQTAKEWAAAKDGRALRGPDGRWLKADA